MMSYRVLKALTILLPTIIIGGFEYIRHEFLLHTISMETGNWIIILLTLIIFYLFAEWMFGTINRKNQQITEEKSRTAVYEERERIAQELHDHIAQILFFMNVKLKQGKIEESREALSEIDTHLRQAIFNLRISPEDGASFIARIKNWLHEWSMITVIEVSQDIVVPDEYYTTTEEVQLFAIIQEAFTNIRKHSQAKRTKLVLHAAPHRWTLEIHDDGIGFEHEDVHMKKYGISMMSKRANELQATFESRSSIHEGTELRVTARRLQ